ncbi:hypothetical protein [uncultured Paenibacillus sp.]|uniref:hypothetical protein n=1 Tax=Paenibacillus sp. TaxID=58172 RepID=UPI0037DCF8E5
MPQLVDRFGRTLDYLRISVTDQCNLRCMYCMSKEGMDFLKNDKLLSFDEIDSCLLKASPYSFHRIHATAEFLTQPRIQTLHWLRIIGDTIFAIGVLALGWFVLGLKTGWSLDSNVHEYSKALSKTAK